MPTVAGVEVLVEAVKMRDPVTPYGAAAEHVAAETLLTLVSPP